MNANIFSAGDGGMLVEFRIPEILLGALMAVALFAMGFVAASSISPPQADEIAKGLSHGGAEDRIANYTLWLALLTGVLAISTVGLWVATILSLRHARETAERQLRAYVCVAKGMIKNFSPDKIPEVVVWLKNVGQTPAYDVQSWLAIEGDSLPRKKPFKSDWKFTDHKSVIGPGEGSTILIDTEAPITAKYIDAIKDRRWAIWGYGLIRYRDAFGKNRTTEFRLIYNGNARHAMFVEANGNDAT
jgi:hypothetical protein